MPTHRRNGRTEMFTRSDRHAMVFWSEHNPASPPHPGKESVLKRMGRIEYTSPYQSRLTIPERAYWGQVIVRWYPNEEWSAKGLTPLQAVANSYHHAVDLLHRKAVADYAKKIVIDDAA